MTSTVQEFLAGTRPFSSLPRHLLGEAVARVAVRHLAEGEHLPLEAETVVVVRSGLVALDHADGGQELLLDGDLAGLPTLLEAEQAAGGKHLLARTDASLLLLPAADLRPCLAVEAFLQGCRQRLERGRHLREAQGQALEPPDPFLRLAIRNIAVRPPLYVAPDHSLALVARQMRDSGAKVCLVGSAQALQGILTEHDVVLAVAAGQVEAATAGSVMRTSLVTVAGDELLVEAFSRMVAHGIRRLVVVDGQRRPEAIVEERDLLSVRGENPVHLAGRIAAAETPEALKECHQRVEALALRTVAEGLPPANLGRLMALLHDQIMVRLADLLAPAHGLSPRHCCLAVLGSAGRREQFFATDQDNALILADGVSDLEMEAHAAFAREYALALAVIGFPPCPHGVMVNNAEWRRTWSQWQHAVDDMLLAADATAVLKLSLLADLRPVWGEGGLATRLRGHLLRRLVDHPVVLKYMAREALRFSPPLGFFGQLVTERSADGKGRVDIKKGGIFPLTQGVRTLALDLGGAAGTAASTPERLAALTTAGVFSPALGASLAEALDALQGLRVRAQAGGVRQGQVADNLLVPHSLSTLERERLKECFKVVGEFQTLLQNKYGLRLLT